MERSEIESAGSNSEPDQNQTIEDEGRLTDLSLAGVGTLSEVMGVEEASNYITNIKETRRYLQERALKRFGAPIGHLVRTHTHK